MYYKTLASLSRVNLLHELQTRGAMTVDDLAAATGMHHNTAREHLHRLIETGLARGDPIPRETRGRPKLLYRAATEPEDPQRQSRLRAAESRTEELRRILPLAGAPAPARADPQLDILDDHMDQVGIEATIDTGAGCMTMHDCPFASIAETNPQVCRVHHGLIADALALVDGPMRAGELHPFSAAGECTLHLTVVERDAPRARAQG